MKKENRFLNAIKWWLKSFLWVAPLIFVIDQVTKLLVYYNDTNITVIPNFFTIKLSWNLGAAWSLFEEHPAILAIISVVGTIGFITYLALKYKTISFRYRMSILLMLAGCAGNMIDRVMQVFPNNIHSGKGVIDFLAFRLFDAYNFPVFNVADMSLVIGVFLLMLFMILDEVRQKNEPKNKSDNA